MQGVVCCALHWALFCVSCAEGDLWADLRVCLCPPVVVVVSPAEGGGGWGETNATCVEGRVGVRHTRSAG